MDWFLAVPLPASHSWPALQCKRSFPPRVQSQISARCLQHFACSTFKVDCMHYLEARPWTTLPPGLPVDIESLTIQAPSANSKQPASAHEPFCPLAKGKRMHAIFKNRWPSYCALRSLYAMCFWCILLIVYAFSIYAIQNGSIVDVPHSKCSTCVLNALHPKRRTFSMYCTQNAMHAFWMGPIENIGVLNATHPKHVKLDNLADVPFWQDAGKQASGRNGTWAGLSKSSDTQYTI